MLRIKSDINLKELEKYGFEYEETYLFYRINNSEVLEIQINPTSKFHREIRLYIDDEYYCCFASKKVFDLLYDLIKDGLVEKIDIRK